MIKPILFNIYNTLCQADMSVLNWGVWLPLSFTFCRDAFSSKLNKLATTKPSQYSLMKVNDMSDMFMGIYADFIWLTLVVWRPYIKHHYVEILFSFFFFFFNRSNDQWDAFQDPGLCAWWASFRAGWKTLFVAVTHRQLGILEILQEKLW